MEKSLSIMFIDIVDSTRLYERLGNRQAANLTQDFLNALRAAAERHRGTLVKSLGDGLLLSFAEPDGAYAAAEKMLELQKSFGLLVRVGLHRGEVIERGNDIFGDAVNVTARVESLARPGEILATEDLVSALSPPLRHTARMFDVLIVKGKTVPTRIYRFEIVESTETTIIGSFLTRKPEEKHWQLRLSCGSRTVSVTEEASLIIGREPDCGLVVQSSFCSRRHASIDYGREHFVIRDQSTNGTYIKNEGGQSVFIRRDAMKLLGSGLIGFGREPESATQEHVARFVCELA